MFQINDGDVSPPLDMTRKKERADASQRRQIIREHVAPVIPIVATPFPVVEPMVDAF